MEIDWNNPSPSNQRSLRLSFTPESESFWQQLPSLPGIYIFEDENKKPLYIGKSISLKSRIKQHYEGFATSSTKAANFIPQTKTLYLKTVSNDLQAIIIEANYIRQYKPRYNAITKDDKSNVYIIFTNPPDTKIKIIHATDIQSLGLDNYQKQIYGPYTSVTAAEIILKQSRRIFGFCNAPFNGHNRACFNFHLGHCPGACLSQISPEKYQRHLGQIKKFLSGHFSQLNKSLNTKIKSAIKNEQFEKAEIIKKQIESLSQALNSQSSSLLLKLSDATDQLQHRLVLSLNHPKLNKFPYRIECYDLAHLQGENYVGSMAVYINGHPETSLYRHFNIKGERDRSDPHAMRQILGRRFQHPEWERPSLIVLDGGIPQLSIVSDVIPKDIAVIALAKKRETIYYFDQNKKVITICLPLEDPVLNLFRSIRDEAHRFANSFHRRKQRRSLVS